MSVKVISIIGIVFSLVEVVGSVSEIDVDEISVEVGNSMLELNVDKVSDDISTSKTK